MTRHDGGTRAIARPLGVTLLEGPEKIHSAEPVAWRASDAPKP